MVFYTIQMQILGIPGYWLSLIDAGQLGFDPLTQHWGEVASFRHHDPWSSMPEGWHTSVRYCKFRNLDRGSFPVPNLHLRHFANANSCTNCLNFPRILMSNWGTLWVWEGARVSPRRWQMETFWRDPGLYHWYKEICHTLLGSGFDGGTLWWYITRYWVF